MQLDPKTTHLRISTTHGKPFRRFGRVYGSAPELVPIDEFNDKQRAELLREPRTHQTARREGAERTEVLLLRVEQCVVESGGTRLVSEPPPPPPKPAARPAARAPQKTDDADDDKGGKGKSSK